MNYIRCLFLVLLTVCTATAQAVQTDLFSIVYAFSRRVSSTNADGAFPNATLIRAHDGLLYGTTSQGGPSGYGTVFKMTAGGVLTTLAHFNGTNGRRPEGPLVFARDGNFYGTTANGGAKNIGTVFKITPAGVLTNLYAFTGGDDGSYPLCGLVQYTDGTLYGTTQAGGTNNLGTIFKITTNGSLTKLVSFTTARGTFPYGGLVLASNGDFYGTAEKGGLYGAGTVFRLTPSGALTTLHSFNITDGSSPRGALIQARDGNLWGTTQMGGDRSVNTNGYGTVFKMTLSGTLTRVDYIRSNHGASPVAGLCQGDDDHFYGTTEFGYLFRLGANNRIIPLITFYGTNGLFPRAGLVQGADGYYYGATQQGGGSGSQGAIFRLNMRPHVKVVSRTDQEHVLGWSAVPGLRYQPQSATNLNLWEDVGVVIESQSTSAQIHVPVKPDPQRLFRVVLLP